MNQKPKCIIITGRPGSGKSTLARRLGERLCIPVISRDELKEGYVNTYGVKHDELPPDTNGLVSSFFFDIVNQYLASNICVVVEAAFQHQVWEPRMPKIFELAQVWMILCRTDDVVAAKRHVQRGLENPTREFFHGDRTVTHYKKSGETLAPESYAPPEFNVPTIHVATDSEYVPSIDEIVTQIRSSEIPHCSSQSEMEVNRDLRNVDSMRMSTAAGDAPIQVRVAEQDDLMFVGQDKYVTQEVLQRKIAVREVFVAEIKEAPVGYLRLEFLWSSIPYIGLIRVNENRRRQGVGRALVHFVEKQMKSNGYQVLYSSSQANEEEPQAWHRTIGFQECGIIAGINRGGIDEIFFRKRLI